MELFSKTESLVNVSNSLLKYYGLAPFHSTYKPLDNLLAKNKGKKICLFLFDGFGSYIQDIYKADIPFIYSHRRFRITSVFPPTTVAATTSLLTGKYPIETGWMGWTQKFPDDLRPRTMFYSMLIDGVTPAKIKSELEEPTKEIFELINESGEHKSLRLMGFKLQPSTTENLFGNTEAALSSFDFIYSYWGEPDLSLHEYGTHDVHISKIAADLDEKMKAIADSHKDVLFISLADHGHIDMTFQSINEHQDFFDCLRDKDYSLESRAAVFYVKDGRKEEFRRLAEKYYGEDYDIFSSEEVIKNHIFGYGKECANFHYLIGDFLLIAKAGHALSIPETRLEMKSNHAGGTEKERYINISIYNEN